MREVLKLNHCCKGLALAVVGLLEITVFRGGGVDEEEEEEEEATGRGTTDFSSERYELGELVLGLTASV